MCSFYRKSILLLFIWLPLVLQAGNSPVVIEGKVTQSIGLKTDFYLDKSATLTIDQLLDPATDIQFSRAAEETLNFGPTNSACWVRFTYLNADSAQSFLEVGNTNLELIDFYVVDDGKIITFKQGGLKGQHSEETFKLNAWLFELPPALNGKKYQVYLRATDKRRVILPLLITDLNSTMRANHRIDFLFGFYFGFIGIIAIMNIFFFTYFREKMYLYYSLHIITQMLINGILKGYLLTLFGSSVYFISPYVSGLAGVSNIFFILFSLYFLEVKKNFPGWYKFCIWLMVLPAINVVLNFTGIITFSAKAGTYIGTIVSISLIALGVHMYRHNVKQARFYLIGWGSFFLGILILNAALDQWLPVTTFTYNAAVFGTLLEVVMISSALADRINLVRIERQQERDQRIRLMEQQTAWLEENVRNRTLELSDKNKEIEAQNEELKQQHEELRATHELLEKQKRLAEEQNAVIGSINQNLEQKVNERTTELEATVKSLIKQNQDLEQFSFTVSHNMRAPVARILGLLDLIKLTGTNDQERELMMEYLRESAVGLDQIIHDLSNIIAVRKGMDTPMEKIDLEKVLRHNQSDLMDEINRAEAKISTTVQTRELVSVRGYVQSILYNLLSNAIKYRSPDRKLLIDINVFENNGHVVFQVKDNGLGINIPKTRLSEIFHLYKRIHTHVQGKGLGLYLVKTQVEGLHGHIEVETEPGEGTMFTVSIPKN